MDFLCLELLRQKRALAGLLLGGQSAVPDETRVSDSLDFNEPSVYDLRDGPLPASLLPVDAFGLADAVNPLESQAFAVSSDGLAYFGAAPSENGALRHKLTRSLAASLPFPHVPPALARSLERPSRNVPLGEIEGLPDSGGTAASDSSTGFKAAVPAEWQNAGGGPMAASVAGASVGGLRGTGFVGASAGYDAARAVSLAFQRDARRYDGGFLS